MCEKSDKGGGLGMVPRGKKEAAKGKLVWEGERKEGMGRREEK